MNSKSEQIFKKESLEYFKRGFDSKKYLKDQPLDDFTSVFDSVISPKNFRVLDVGCGSGMNLRFLSKKYNCECFGVEPNRELVNKLNQDNSKSGQRIKYSTGYSNKLDFEDDSFDLVICWSVLHWVHRNYILQSLGEILRVSRKYILLMDFCPYKSYRTLYKYKSDVYTYKIDYTDIFEKTGIIKKVDELHYFYPTVQNGQDRKYRLINRNDLKTIKYDWVARKRSVLEKSAGLLPLKLESSLKHY
jgi:ubiquinone/menaquinone biosynthesis C-methylase UbiE